MIKHKHKNCHVNFYQQNLMYFSGLVYYVTRTNFISKNPKFYTAILNSLILAKCVYARLWENSAYVSKQLKGIGPIFSTLLASAGKVNFMLLEESHPRDLERVSYHYYFYLQFITHIMSLAG